MRFDPYKLAVALVAASMALAIGGCADGDLDDPDSPPSELQVEITQSPALEGQLVSGTCVLTVEEWTVTYNNVAKNSLATNSPFSDYFVESVTVSYTWPDVAVPIPPDRTIPSPGTVAIGATQGIRFEPILSQDLDGSMLGTSGILTLTIHARYGDGTRVTRQIGEVLQVNDCTT